MFLIKFFYFLKGYVIIEAYGNSVWKLVSECALKGIKIYNISGGERASFVMLQDDFYDVFKLSESMGVILKIKKVQGVEHLVHKYRKRIGFPVGVGIFALFFIISSGYLWDIKVETQGRVTEVQVLELLEEIGVKPGIRLSHLPDGTTMKNHLVNSLDNVPWAWVYVNGVRARVCVHEGRVPPVVVDEDETCNVIAACDGFITEMSVKRGMKCAQPGNAVNAGDVLISGIVEVGKDDSKKYYTVHAEGDVIAHTRHERSGKYSLFEERPEFSGREKNVYKITFLSKEYNVFSKPEYEYSIKTNKKILSLGFLELEKIKYMEAERIKVQLPEEWVIEFAKRDLTAQISAELGSFARLIKDDYIVEKNGNFLTVKAVMEFTENIGVKVPG